ncbi:MAG TPA: lysine--tRNA ligase [bacterium]|nr:lysine--tRNA ligase [bacterium]
MSQEKTNDELMAIRRNKVAKLRELGIDPFPGTVNRTHTNQQLLDTYDAQATAETVVSAVGRIRSLRMHGGSTFAHIEDGSAKIQIYFKKDLLGEDQFSQLELFDIGDFIEVQGTLFTTHKGEKTILVQKLRMLSKAIRQFPNEWYGLKDIEARYRKRYLDFAVNKDVRDKMYARFTIINTVREFLVNKGFIELENPMLEIAASGAMARPFSTHINAYDLDIYLRICIELWQKMSLVGGFERVFEIGRAFRNEGVDFEHNPEFTILEYYWAYASLEDNMHLHEELFSLLAQKLFGATMFTCRGHDINLTPPFRRLTFREAILENTSIDIESYPTKETIMPILDKLHIEYDPKLGYGKLLDELYKNTTRPKLIQPTFITQYPLELKPLAKAVAGDRRYSDIFQLLIAGMEVSNSYNELNDPIDQRQRFAEQTKFAAAGDGEAMESDENYVEAMEYGMPPATGTGIGMDRLVALLTDSSHLREIIPYPLMKPEKKSASPAINDKNVREQESIVLGKIIDIKDHPNADTLKVCKVTVGTETLTILSNCSNLKTNLYIAVALPGAVILDWHGTGKTQKVVPTDMRGIVSEAVMCAAEELGIHVPEEQREPLYELKADDALLGTPIKNIITSTDNETSLAHELLAQADPAVFKIDPEVAKRFPDLTIGIAVINDVQVQTSTPELEQYRQQVLDNLKSYDKDAWKSSRKLASYRAIYKAFGVDANSRRPSADALLHRISRGKGLYNVNTVVDTYNLVSAQTELCMAAYDADTIAYPLTLRFAQEGDTIRMIGEESPEQITAGELVYADADKVTCLDFNYRDSDLTKISEKTKNIIVLVDGCGAITASEVAQALTEVSEILTRYNGGSISKQFILSASQSDPTPQTPATGPDASLDPNAQAGITREDALAFLQEHMKSESTLKHSLAAEAACRAYAMKYGANPDLWGIAGLLHDIAWEEDPDTHPTVGADWCRSKGINELICHSIEAHAHDVSGIAFHTMLDKVLFTSEELTGLISAAAMILPSKKIADLQTKSVVKKFKNKSFAANVNRDTISQCESLLDISLEDHITTVLGAMQSIAL